MKNKNRIRMMEGIKNMMRNKVLVLIPAVYLVMIIVAGKFAKEYIPRMTFWGMENLDEILLNIVMIEFAITGIACIFIRLGIPRNVKEVEKRMVKAGFCDRDKCPPIFLRMTSDKKNQVVTYEFFSETIPLEMYEQKIEMLRTILKNANIEKNDISYGSDTQHIKIESAFAKKKFQS